MHRAQDWELNYRLRTSGRLIWFSPELRVTYRPRSSLRALVQQMYDTGKWRREVVRRHSDTASARYLAPPAAVIGIVGGTLAAGLGRRVGSRLLQLGALAPLVYAGFVGYVALTAPPTLSTGRPAPAADRAGGDPPGVGERVPGRPTPSSGLSPSPAPRHQPNSAAPTSLRRRCGAPPHRALNSLDSSRQAI